MAECGCSGGKGKGGISKYSGGGPSGGYKTSSGLANYGVSGKQDAISRYTPPVNVGRVGNYDLGKAMSRYERPLPIFAALHRADGFGIDNSKQRYSHPMTRPAYAYDPLMELENRRKKFRQ